MSKPKPVVYIAFANDLEHPERNLTGLQKEAANIATALGAVASDDGSWRLHPNHDCTPAGLAEPFYSQAVAIFHFGGHANPEQILLETKDGANRPASAKQLAEFLAKEETLKLVFLNACSTRQWALNLVRLGVPCVIATSCPIHDDIAQAFAKHFYEALASDATIVKAYEQAVTGVAFSDGPTRDFDGLDDRGAKADEFPWILYCRSETVPDDVWIYPVEKLSARARPVDEMPAACHWRLSIGAHDPLIGLPPLDATKYPLPPTPYVSIEGHQPTDAQIFFGRNAEIRELYDWTLKGVDAPPVLLFYGQSGAGKSSLLRAGLLPRLDDRCEVVYSRRGQDLMSDLHSAIGGATDDAVAGWLVSQSPKLIILDQVEEAITHQDGPAEELKDFVERVKRIFLLRPANSTARLILSFRKEYLAEIRNLLVAGAEDGGGGLIAELWLKRLDQDAITQVVLGPLRSRLLRETYRIKIENADANGEEDFALHVAHTLEEPNSPVATVLQILLQRMWDAAPRDGENRVYSKDLYDAVRKGNALEVFYRQQLDALYGTFSDAKDGLALDLLYEHTTDLGTSRRWSIEDLARERYPHVQNLAKLIEKQKALHLLAEPDGDDVAAGGVSMLSHDTLAAVVRQNFALSQLRGQRARRILENRAPSWSGGAGSDEATKGSERRGWLRGRLRGRGKQGDVLGNAELRFVEAGLSQMRTTTVGENELIEKSREQRRRSTRATALAITAIAIAFVLSFIYLQQGTKVTTLADQSRVELAYDERPGVNQLGALLAQMQAMESLHRSWLVRLLPHWRWLPYGTLRADVTAGLQKTLENTDEVGRYPLNNLGVAIGECAVAFDENDHLRFLSVGDTGGILNGKLVGDFFSSSGRLSCDATSGQMARVSEAGGIEVWRNGSVTKIEEPALGRPGISGGIAPIALSPDGDQMAFADPGDSANPKDSGYKVSIYGFQKKKVADVLSTSAEGVWVLAYSDDGRWLAAGTGGAILWDLHGKTKRNDISGGDAMASQIKFVSNATGTYLVAMFVGSPQKYALPYTSVVKLPEMKEVEGDLSYTDPAPTAIALNSTATLLAIGTSDGGVDLWTVPPARNSIGGVKVTRHFRASTEPIRQIGFSPDSKLIATTSAEEDAFGDIKGGTVRVWVVDSTATAKGAETSKLPPQEKLFWTACQRVQVYLEEMEKPEMSSAPEVTGVQAPLARADVDLSALRSACKAALK